MSHLVGCGALRFRASLLAAFALTTLLFASPCKADGTPKVLFLWPSGAPGEDGRADQERQEPPRKGDSTIRVTEVSRPSITVYPADPAKANGTGVLICPGGGYRILAFNKEGTEVAEWLNKLGVTAFVLKYRVPAREGMERHQAPIQDAQRALRLIRQRAGEWKLDANRIGVLGFSAGGHLAALLSTNSIPASYEPSDQVDQLSSQPNFSLLIYPAYLATKNDELAPPVTVDPKTTPRAFLVQTQDDGVRVESSVAYYLALKRAKIPVEMHLYPRGGHGYGLRPSENTVSSWPSRAEDWLKSNGLLSGTP